MSELLVPNNMATELTCPLCGGRLLVKTNRETQHQFLGCERFSLTGCTYTEPRIPEGIRMRLMGAPTLPGME